MSATIETTAREKIRSFTSLHAWQQGHALVLTVYRLTASFPTDEKFGLTSQLRRAAVSITSNIAEGFSRRSAAEKKQFFTTALASLTEIQNQLLVARDVGHIDHSSFDAVAAQSIRVSKLTNGLIKSTGNLEH